MLHLTPTQIVPIAIIEIEVSLWSYEQEIQDVIAWSKKNKVPVFCYSPLGRGFISRTYSKPEDIPDGDFKKMLPVSKGRYFTTTSSSSTRLTNLPRRKV